MEPDSGSLRLCAPVIIGTIVSRHETWFEWVRDWWCPRARAMVLVMKRNWNGPLWQYLMSIWKHELLVACIAITVIWVVSAIDIDHWNPSRPLHHLNASGILHHFNNIVASGILPFLRLVPL